VSYPAKCDVLLVLWATGSLRLAQVIRDGVQVRRPLELEGKPAGVLDVFAAPVGLALAVERAEGWQAARRGDVVEYVG
jgi:hypothetical protein